VKWVLRKTDETKAKEWQHDDHSADEETDFGTLVA
jgi:hypothetical protein